MQNEPRQFVEKGTLVSAIRWNQKEAEINQAAGGFDTNGVLHTGDNTGVIRIGKNNLPVRHGQWIVRKSGPNGESVNILNDSDFNDLYTPNDGQVPPSLKAEVMDLLLQFYGYTCLQEGVTERLRCNWADCTEPCSLTVLMDYVGITPEEREAILKAARPTEPPSEAEEAKPDEKEDPSDDSGEKPAYVTH